MFSPGDIWMQDCTFWHIQKMLNVPSKPSRWHYVACLLKGSKVPQLKPSEAIEDATFKVICRFCAVYESLVARGAIFQYVWLFIHHNTEYQRCPWQSSVRVQCFLSLSPGWSVNVATQRETDDDVLDEIVMFKT